MNIGFTGSSKFVTLKQLDSLRDLLDQWEVKFGKGKSVKVHHGDCIKADEEFNRVCELRGYYIVIHPPTNISKRAWCTGFDELRPPKDYLTRNHHIVDETERLIAMPNQSEEILRSGTWATIRYARTLCRDIFIIYPNGVVEHEKRGGCDD